MATTDKPTKKPRKKTLKFEDIIILAVGNRVWGRGPTIDEALRQMKLIGRSREYKLFLCHKLTYVDPMGCLSYPAEFPPRELTHKGAPRKGKKR